MIIPITHTSKNFYAHLGPIFGSRKVEKMTGDRFYDDDDKIWYLYYDKGVPDTFVGILNNVIKNVWTEKPEHLILVFKDINKKMTIKESIVPSLFNDIYIKSGYELVDHDYKNFLKIRSGSSD